MIAMIAEWDLHDCLLYLNENEIEDEMIIEKMGIKKHTMNQWWKTKKTNPKSLAILRKWCEDFAPVEWTCPYDIPTQGMYMSALERKMHHLKKTHQKGKVADHMYWTTHTHFLPDWIQKEYCSAKGDYARCRDNKNYYTDGLPITKKRHWAVKPPDPKIVVKIVAMFHPDERVRDHFISVTLRDS